MGIAWLFIPADKKKYLQKMTSLNPDCIIFDLEDSVALKEKRNARLNISVILNKNSGKKYYVRTNRLGTEEFINDMNAVVNDGLTGILLPKVNKKDDIFIFESQINKIEIERGIPNGAIKLVPIIETAEGLMNAYEIALASKRVERLAFGVEDFLLEMNIQPSEDEMELLNARSQLVISSRAANIDAPIDSVFSDFRNLEGLKRSAERGKQLGFGGKLLIHPVQIEIVKYIYVPTNKQLKEAEKIVESYKKSINNGEGAIQVDGKMIDTPVAERAKRLLFHAKERKK